MNFMNILVDLAEFPYKKFLLNEKFFNFLSRKDVAVNKTSDLDLENYSIFFYLFWSHIKVLIIYSGRYCRKNWNSSINQFQPWKCRSFWPIFLIRLYIWKKSEAPKVYFLKSHPSTIAKPITYTHKPVTFNTIPAQQASRLAYISIIIPFV